MIEETVALEQSISGEERVERKCQCELCDFKRNWHNGLGIHMSRKHSKLEQLDGKTSIHEASEDEKYSSTRHYLKNGWLGSAYQTFVDATEVIDACDLHEDVRYIQKTKVLEARKCALPGSSSLEFFSSLGDPDPSPILEP